MITFYDIAAQPSISTWSLNPWKTRYTLGFKKLPYKTIPIEYPDIASVSESLGIPPFRTKDGVALYTCPAIIDDATGVALPDSYKIAEYLDKQYPDTPKVFPPGTEAFHAAFYTQIFQMIDPVWDLLLPRVPGAVLNPPSAEYFIRTRSASFGKPLADLEPVGEARTEAWAKLKANFGEVDGWLKKSSGPFFMGETPVFADFMVAGIFQWIKVVLRESSDEWKDIREWHNGRWENLLKDLKQYEGPDS